MGSFIASSYDCGSLILLLDSVMEIACSCVVGAGGAGSAELSSMLVVGLLLSGLLLSGLLLLLFLYALSLAFPLA